jgi:hypothetical protein
MTTQPADIINAAWLGNAKRPRHPEGQWGQLTVPICRREENLLWLPLGGIR